MKKKEILLPFGLIAIFILEYLLGKVIGEIISYDFWQCALIFSIGLLFFALSIFYVFFHQHIAVQLFLPITILVLFWDGALVSSSAPDKLNLYSMLVSFFLNLAELVLFAYVRILNLSYKKIKGFIGEYKIELIICLLFIAGTLPVLDKWLGAGAFDYYEHIRKYIGNWDCNKLPIEQLKICGHKSQIYGIFMGLGSFLTPNSVIGPRIIQVSMACVTILAYSMIVKRIFPFFSKNYRTLLVAIFAFSPLLFGLICEINPDLGVLCFFVWLIWAQLYEYILLEICFAIFLCFSKETGVVIYGMYMLALILVYFYTSREKNISFRIKNIITNRKILYRMLPGYIYLLLHFTDSIPSWDGGSTGKRAVNVPGIDPEYIVYKLRQLLSPNFFWIFLLVFLFGVIQYIVYKIRNKKTKITKITDNHSGILRKNIVFWYTLFASAAGFLTVSLFYITWTNYRYFIPYLLFINILFCIGIDLLEDYSNYKYKKWLCYGIMSITLALTVLSNFKTIDHLCPASPYVYDVGQDNIIGTQMFYTDEEAGITTDETAKGFAYIGSVYNREYLEIGDAIENFLESVNYSEEDLVVLPYHFDTYTTYNNLLYRRLDYGANNLYWNKKKNELTVNYALSDFSNTPEYEKFNVAVFMNYEDYKDIKKSYRNIYAIELPFYQDYSYNRSGYDEKSFDYRTMASEKAEYTTFNYKLSVYKLK